jgi:pyrroloquinoline quinone biosynthesis protein B
MKKNLHALVLGAAAGGGLPQWNCGCPNCADARSGSIIGQTQSSLAVSADGEAWAILNASPDIRQQIQNNAALHPDGLRHTPIRSVLLTNGDIDHIAGLLVLRERQPFTVFLTREIADVLAQNPIFNALDKNVVAFRVIELRAVFELAPGLRAELFPVPGKVPLFMEAGDVVTDLEGEQTVGVRLMAGPSEAWYIPGCARLTDHLAARLRGSELVFFDGTVFNNTEMPDRGTGEKTGTRMGHMAMSGPNGSLASFRDLDVKRKIFVHINNTNPVWQCDSLERETVENAGWQIAHDGMELAL